MSRKISTTFRRTQHHLRHRLETIGSFEDLFCGVKCLQFEDNCIILSLKTPILPLDSSILKKKIDCSLEPTVLNHGLLIEVTEKMQLKKIEIFPDDVHLDGIINVVNSPRMLPISAGEGIFCWLLRQIQQRIILSNLRHLLVKNASKFGRSISYSDKDETITTDLEGGLLASFKASHEWPLSTYPLRLCSLKHSDSHSKSIPLGFLYKMQEQANSLDIDRRHDLVQFLDSIEALVMEIQAKHTSTNASF